jgi:dipeptidyl aminopeptidase/acylaminoacyl peptidase
MVMLAAAMAAATPLVTVEDIVATRDISGVIISPDGRWVAYRVSEPSVAENRVVLGWHIIGVDGGEPRRVADGGAARFSFAGTLIENAPIWDADSKGFHFLAMQDGAVGVWSWRMGGKARLAISDPADIVDFRIADDGRRIIYHVGATRAQIAAAEKRAYDEGVLVDPTVDVMQPFAGGAIVDGKRVMQRLRGGWFERVRLLADTPPTEKSAMVWGSAQPDSPVPQTSAIGQHVVAGDSAEARIVRDGGKTRVDVLQPGHPPLECAIAACASPRLRALGWRPDGKALLLFEASPGSEETISLWRLNGEAPERLAVTDGAPFSPFNPDRCAIGPAFLVCAEASGVSPPRLVRVDYSSGARKLLVDPNADLRRKIATKATPMSWSIAGGQKFSGFLLRPAHAAPPFPLVIQYYHCDGFLKGGVGDEIPMLPLADSGIAVLCIRKAQGKFSNAEEEYDLALSGISAAIDTLAADGIVDPRHVGIGGLSFGSQVALWAIRKSDRFAAATLSSAQFEPHFYWATALPGSGMPDTLANRWGLGDPDTDPEGWNRLSATSDAAALDTPLLMQLPEAEARLVIEFHTRLKRAGKPAELFVFADEPHIKTQPVHQFAVNARNLDWYRFWLADFEDPNPQKQDRYARWRELRAGHPLQRPAP